MKRLTSFLLALLLPVLILGCSGDKDKGINKDRDKPRPGPTQK
jgi:hypothetical protein